MFIQQQSLKIPSPSAELPGASALQGSAWRALVPPFPLEVFILGWERSLARLLGRLGAGRAAAPHPPGNGRYPLLMRAVT